MPTVETMESFALICYKLLLSDRDVNFATGGFTGEGKSTFTTKFMKAYGEVSGTGWDFDKMTWSRKEMLTWIDGDKKGLGQLPEFSGINIDELWLLFYKRNWYDEGQIDALATLNMCRDRHLMIGGNVPVFWDLDGAYLSRMRFYIYVPERGKAWVFEQENNPFNPDPWNKNLCAKMFRSFKNPYRLPNFLCEIHFDDWDKSEKKRYYAIRNKKRVLAIKDNKKNTKESHKMIKTQRDTMIRYFIDYQNDLILNHKDLFTSKQLSKVNMTELGKTLGLTGSAIRMIKAGKR